MCVYWAAMGECRINRNWMETNCMRACNVCPADDIPVVTTTTTNRPPTTTTSPMIPGRRTTAYAVQILKLKYKCKGKIIWLLFSSY